MHTDSSLNVDTYQQIVEYFKLYPEELMCGCRVYQRKFEWFFSKYNQTVDFVDGMIILNTPDIQDV